MLKGRLALARAVERVKLLQHLCVVYDRRDEQLAMVEPFVRAGLERREQCLYVLIRGVLQTHPRVIFGGLVCSNPHYIPPEEFLNPDEDAEITRLLRTLVARERALEN